MATPIVGSVIGLMRSINPSWNNDQLISMVLGTSDPIIYDIKDNHIVFEKQWLKRKAYYKKQNYNILSNGQWSSMK